VSAFDNYLNPCLSTRMTGDARARSETCRPAPRSCGLNTGLSMSSGNTTIARCAGRSFMDPQFSPRHAQFIPENADVLTEGLVTRVQDRRRDHWVCGPCFEDFATEFG
jgi:hypothetical protein